jgi:hypothetical protein
VAVREADRGNASALLHIFAQASGYVPANATGDHPGPHGALMSLRQILQSP